MATIDELFDEGLTCFGDGRHDEAVAAFQQVLAQDPSHAEALRSLSMTLYHMGKYPEAIEAGKKLIELLPEDILARTSLSMCYQKAGQIPEAEHESAQARILGWKEQLRANPGAPPPKP